MAAIPTITVEFSVGNTISEQIGAMLELAYRINCFVKAEFNGVMILAPPMYDYNGSRRWRGDSLVAKYESDLAKSFEKPEGDAIVYLEPGAGS